MAICGLLRAGLSIIIQLDNPPETDQGYSLPSTSKNMSESVHSLPLERRQAVRILSPNRPMKMLTQAPPSAITARRERHVELPRGRAGLTRRADEMR